MNNVTPAKARLQVGQKFTAVLSTLLGLDALGGCRLPADIADRAIDGTFDLLAEIGVRRASNGANPGRLRCGPCIILIVRGSRSGGLLGVDAFERGTAGVLAAQFGSRIRQSDRNPVLGLDFETAWEIVLLFEEDAGIGGNGSSDFFNDIGRERA